MAFSPKTGLVYIPAQEIPGAYGTDDKFAFDPGQWNTTPVDTKLNSLPPDPKARAAMKNSMRGELIAWDPVAGKEVWRAEHKGPWNGGVLTTAGGLVFQGTADGHLNAYDAATGKPVWSTETYTATLAGPMTYTVDGEQYVALGAGFGSVFYLVAGFAAPKQGNPDNGRILVYKLGGAARLPAPSLTRIEIPKPPAATASPTLVATGHATYNHYCLVCHGYNAISGGVIPDLRYSPLIGSQEALDSVVLGGALKDEGMVSFAKVLKPEDTQALRAYIISEANGAYAQEHAQTVKGLGKQPRVMLERRSCPLGRGDQREPEVLEPERNADDGDALRHPHSHMGERDVPAGEQEPDDVEEQAPGRPCPDRRGQRRCRADDPPRSRPNGAKAKMPIRNAAADQGRPTMVMARMTAPSIQARPPTRSPKDEPQNVEQQRHHGLRSASAPVPTGWREVARAPWPSDRPIHSGFGAV